MPAIARKGDTVLSADGTGYNCGSPMETSVDQVNGNSVKANNILIVVQGNKVAMHNKGGCSPDESTLTSFSSTYLLKSLSISLAFGSRGFGAAKKRTRPPSTSFFAVLSLSRID